ncbi:cilia- and flagella-associated protein HOATZ [Boleophthalmus pectinirostris]|uniref:cilia- and flagella-associated protein HOATZ n=1 Tax=Boleophthalmus pectinirostris TaxID=150288 RepID=UPI000A1C26F5|nr:cilia- and flagella-associated protein HOATZ [Boleophthalmus pectinirostris]
MLPHSESVEEQAEVEKYLTVFEGSSPEDVSHARQLWSSLSLLPPQESRLVSADIRQRLPVSRPQQRRSTAIAGPSVSVPEPASLVTAREKQRREERRKYEAMAENRRQILELLKKQREQRIQKELLSRDYKPKQESEEMDQSQNRDQYESDLELVQQLH